MSSWLSGMFGKKKEEPILPTTVAPSPPSTPLTDVVVNKQAAANSGVGATAPKISNSLTGAQISAGVLKPTGTSARRENGYVALGGSREKSKKAKKSKKSKNAKSKKAKKSLK